MTAVVSASQGDYEAVKVLSALTATTARVTISGEASDDSGDVREITISRTVRREDMRNARTIRRYFHESDPAEFPGTTPGGNYPTAGVPFPSNFPESVRAEMAAAC